MAASEIASPIAAGAGRYVIETIRNLPEIPIGATLCDYKQENVDAARHLADELNLDGAVVARLSVDGAEFWVADESPEHRNFSPESLGGGTVRMILTVADPDAVFARALATRTR